MNKKEVTRAEKYEDYRNSIEDSTLPREKDVKNKPTKARKTQVSNIILTSSKKKYKNLMIYYLIVLLFIIITIIVLVYFGEQIYG